VNGCCNLTHLTSAKAAGKSAVMAPPKRSTCLKVAIFVRFVVFRRLCFGCLWCSERWNRFFWGPRWNVVESGRVEGFFGGDCEFSFRRLDDDFECVEYFSEMIEYLIIHEIGNARQTVEVEVQKRTGSHCLTSLAA
jgi:hypothetical protein